MIRSHSWALSCRMSLLCMWEIVLSARRACVTEQKGCFGFLTIKLRSEVKVYETNCVMRRTMVNL